MIVASNKCFSEYEYLKASLNDCFYRDISINKVLIWEFIMLTYNIEYFNKMTYKDIFISLISTIDFSGLYKIATSNKLIVTNTINRKDYRETTDAILDNICDSSYLDISNCHKKEIRFLKHLSLIYKIVFVQSNLKSLNFKKKIYLFCRMQYYFNLIDELHKKFQNINKLKVEKYLAFNSSYWEETIICQFFNNINIKTFSLSHGLTYGKYISEKPMDATAGGNITANEIFVWGESSKRDLIDIHKLSPEKIIVAGNVKYPERNIEIKTTFKSGIVLLGRAVFDSGNFEILNIISELSQKQNIKFYIKTHPSLNQEKYVQIAAKLNLYLVNSNMTVNELFQSNNFDFAISYNTTSYYEALYHDLICFRYAKGQVEDYFGLNDKFINVETLISLIYYYKNCDKYIISAKVKEVLKESIGMGINEYSEYLK